MYTDIGSVDEAEEVHERDGGHDIPIDLSTQSAFGVRVQVERSGMAVIMSAAIGKHSKYILVIL